MLWAGLPFSAAPGACALRAGAAMSPPGPGRPGGAGPEAGPEAGSALRSVNTRELSEVVFNNHSPRCVLPVWLDFEGRPRCYPVLQPRSGRVMRSYRGGYGGTGRAWAPRGRVDELVAVEFTLLPSHHPLFPFSSPFPSSILTFPFLFPLSLFPLLFFFLFLFPFFLFLSVFPLLLPFFLSPPLSYQ